MSNNTSSRVVNGTQACAACKYQRRKCAPDCILAPYFPHDRQRHFLNAHKLFGVSNITKIIQNLDPPDKDEAMRTIIFQSDVRAADPSGGCYRIIRELQRQIEFSRAELEMVLQQLAICRAQAAAEAHHHHQSQIPIPDAVDDSSTLNSDSIIDPDPLSAYNPMGYDHIQEPHVEEYFLHENNHVVPLQDIAAWAMQDTASSSLHDKQTFVNKFEDIKPTILDIGGERLELKFDHEEETIEQSDEAISKEATAILKDEIASFISKDDKAMVKEDTASVEEPQDHDLKSAATFSPSQTVTVRSD